MARPARRAATSATSSRISIGSGSTGRCVPPQLPLYLPYIPSYLTSTSPGSAGRTRSASLSWCADQSATEVGMRPLREPEGRDAQEPVVCSFRVCVFVPRALINVSGVRTRASLRSKPALAAPRQQPDIFRLLRENNIRDMSQAQMLELYRGLAPLPRSPYHRRHRCRRRTRHRHTCRRCRHCCRPASTEPPPPLPPSPPPDGCPTTWPAIGAVDGAAADRPAGTSRSGGRRPWLARHGVDPTRAPARCSARGRAVPCGTRQPERLRVRFPSRITPRASPHGREEGAGEVLLH